MNIIYPQNEKSKIVLFEPLLVGLVITCLLSSPNPSQHSPTSESKIIQSTRTPVTTRLTASQMGQLHPITFIDAISQIKVLTGFTLEQIAKILGVTRRAIYHWINGQVPSEDKNEKVMRTLSALQYMDRGLVRLNKALLISPTGNGKLLSDYLADDEFEEFIAFAGPGNRSPMLNIDTPAVSPTEKGKIKLIDVLTD